MFKSIRRLFKGLGDINTAMRGDNQIDKSYTTIFINKPIQDKIAELAKANTLTNDEVATQIFKLGFLIAQIEQDGGKFGVKKKDDKRIQYLSFLKDLDDKKKVQSLWDTAIAGVTSDVELPEPPALRYRKDSDV